MNIFTRQLLKLPKQTRRVVRTCVYGLAAGGIAVAFHYAIQWIYGSTLVRLAEGDPTRFVVGSLAVLLISSLSVGLLLQFCPGASGSGIPQLKLAFWKDFGHVPWRVVWVKFIAGALSVGGGASLGREGPSVQLAGGLASNIAGKLGEPKQNRREAAAAGSAAGLAAAFNTPIAAVTFVLEEIIQDLNSRFLGGVLLASILGAFVVYATVGKHPAFIMPEVAATSWVVYLLIPLVAVAAAVLGVFFQKTTLQLRSSRQHSKSIPIWLRPCLGGVITWALGSGVFVMTGHMGVFGLGYEDLSTGLNGGLTWQIAGILLATKVIATIACYGFMGCGGIFAPSLFFGAMTGVVLGGLAGLALPGLHLAATDHTMLAVVGMSACLGAVVRAPMTSILIVFEMTHQFSLVPALMLGTLVSQGVAIALSKRNFYEAILVQDGHNLEHVIPPRDLHSWHRLPVSAIANFQPVICRDTNPAALKDLLKQNPYASFPVVLEGRPISVLTRTEAEGAIREQREPQLEPATWCQPETNIRELQMLLIESQSGMVLLRDKRGGALIGLVTLHDLLRAEVAHGKSS